MPPLDAEEQALLESVELGEWQSVPNVAEKIKRYRRYAQSQGNALELVSIQLPSSDLQALQSFAQKSGTPVSVLMAMVLHQFAVSRQE